MYNTSSSNLAAAGYNFSFGPATGTPSGPSPSGSSYAATYSGIGASPNRNSSVMNPSGVVRSGWANVKEEGFASLFWRPKWLILREQTLAFHKNEVRERMPAPATSVRY